jgi:DNA-binding XRE family transcriptional regulator
MKLKAWRREREIAQWQLAENLSAATLRLFGETRQINQQTVQTWEAGRLPRKWQLELIWWVTNGKVAPNDFCELRELETAA